MQRIHKIHIVGPAGGGKTYASKKISSILQIPAFELDEFFWDRETKDYSKLTLPKVRDEEVQAIVSQTAWIIEGIYYDWVLEGFEKADIIIIIRPNFWLCTVRMLLRFAKAHLGLTHEERKETIKGLIQTIKRNRKYNEVTIKEIVNNLHSYQDKLFLFTNADDAITQLSSFANQGSKLIGVPDFTKINGEIAFE